MPHLGLICPELTGHLNPATTLGRELQRRGQRVTVCHALAMNSDPNVPPGVLPWRYWPGPLGRLRNSFGDALLRWLAKPIVKEVGAYRAAHGLAPLVGGIGAGSPLAQIAQQP